MKHLARHFFLRLLIITIIATTTAMAGGALNGSGWVTFRDFYSIADDSPFQPPFCQIPYAYLDLNRITAVQGLTPDQCGACLQVCGVNSCLFMVAIDRGGHNLDLSDAVKGVLALKHDLAARVRWNQTFPSFCEGIVGPDREGYFM